MGVYMVGEVRRVERKSGTTTDGNKWSMDVLSLLVEGRSGEAIHELVLMKEAEREAWPTRSEVVAYEVEASARVWKGTGSINWSAVRRARELEESIGLHKGEADGSEDKSLHAVGD